MSWLWANMSKYWQRSLIKSPYVSRHHKSWQKYPTFGRISAVKHSTLIQIYRWLRKNSTKSFRPSDLAKKLAKVDQKNFNWRNHGKNIQHLAVYQQWNTPQWYKFIDDFEKILQNSRDLAKKVIKSMYTETFSNYKIKCKNKSI